MTLLCQDPETPVLPLLVGALTATVASVSPASAQEPPPSDPVHSERSVESDRLWSVGSLVEYSSPGFQQLGFGVMVGRTTEGRLFDAAQGYSGLRFIYSLGSGDNDEDVSSAAATIVGEGGADIPLEIGGSQSFVLRLGLLVGVTFTPSALFGRLWHISPGASALYRVGPLFAMVELRFPIFFGLTSEVGLSLCAGLGARF